MFDALIVPVTMKELIRTGFLVPFTLIRPDRQLATDEIARRPVDAYRENAMGRQAIGFALHIKAATEFCDQFKAEGIPSGIVTGVMAAGERRTVLEQYKSGVLRVLWNVGVATEGFDHRPTSCVILARSIGPLALYLQTLGRALRCDAGKENAVLIDLGGSSWTHGSPDDDRTWSLEGDGTGRKSALPSPPERFCAVCGVLVEVDAPSCPGCGIAKPELTTPEVVNAKLVKFAHKLKEPPDKRAACLARWMGESEAKGHKIGAAFYKFKGVYGVTPPPDVATLAKAIYQAACNENK